MNNDGINVVANRSVRHQELRLLDSKRELIGIMTSNIIQDGKSAYRYATSVDNRIENLELLQKQGLKEVVEVAPIEVPITTDPKYFIFNMLGKKSNPQPVLYYISDTDTVPNEYAFHLQRVYLFDFLIKLQNQ